MDYSINPETVVNSVITSLVTKKYGSLTDRLWGKLLSRFAVMRTDLTETPGIADCPTMCTDGKNVYYNPNFVRDLCLDAIEEGRTDIVADRLKFVFAHELMHIVYRNITPDKKETTFDIPGPKDRAWQALHDLVNQATDAVINARLKKEFGNNAFPSKCKKRDADGNVVAELEFCCYEGEIEKAWTQVFVEVCQQANKNMAKALGVHIAEFPDGYYDNIALFRELYNKFSPKREQSQEAGGTGKSSQSGSSGSTKDQQDDQNTQSGSSGSAKGQQGKQDKSESSGSGKGQQEKQDKSGSGPSQDQGSDADSEVRKAAKKILNGNVAMDDHDKNKEISRGNERIAQSKIERAMHDIKKEAAGIGTAPGGGSILISAAERYFRAKPEPWYVGVSMLLKSKMNQGPQIREKVPPVEMLTQAMTGCAVIQFERKTKQLDIAFAVDTSGSMSDNEVLSGVLKILSFIERSVPKGSVGHRLIFCQIDADIADWKELRIPSREYHDFKKAITSNGFKRAGCGGTALAPFLKKIAEMRKKPDAVVVFSDMELSDYPEVEKACVPFKRNVIWLCSGNEVPSEFYNHDIGRVYETTSLFEDDRSR